MNKPNTNAQGDNPKQSEADLSVRIGAALGSLPAPANTPKKNNSSKDAGKEERRMRLTVAVWQKILAPFRFFNIHHGAVTAFTTLVIAVLTYQYVKYSKRQWERMGEANRITQNALTVSQRAVVTIGKKDGTIADIIIPKDRSQSADIVIYFQNSGHIPTKFVWGTQLSFLGKGMTPQPTGIQYVHPFPGFMWRSRDKKTGSIGESGQSSMIAGDSVIQDTLGEVSQDNLAQFPQKRVVLLILGMFEYCDGFGNAIAHNFGITYRSNAPNGPLSFGLAEDNNFPVLPPGKATETTKYLPPCESPSERKQ
jgi:hypothetical protein